MSTKIYRCMYAGFFYLTNHIMWMMLLGIPSFITWSMRGYHLSPKEAPILPKYLGRFSIGGPRAYSSEELLGLFHFNIDNATKNIPVCGRPLFVSEDWTEDRNTSAAMTDSAYVMLRYLEKTWDCGKSFETFAPEGRKARIIELGAGVGSVGMGIQQMLPDHEVYLTDLEYEGGNMPRPKKRIDPLELQKERRKKFVFPPRKEGIVYNALKKGLALNGLENKINVTQLWWHDSYELSMNTDLYGTFDHIIVTECIYNAAKVEDLARMLIRLSHEGTHVWIAGRQVISTWGNFYAFFFSSSADRDSIGGWGRFRRSTEKYFDAQDIPWEKTVGEEEVEFIKKGHMVIQSHFKPFYPPWKYIWRGSEQWWYPVSDKVGVLHLERNSKQIFEESDTLPSFGMEMDELEAELGEDVDEDEIASLRAEIEANRSKAKGKSSDPLSGLQEEMQKKVKDVASKVGLGGLVGKKDEDTDVMSSEPGSTGKTAHELA